MSGERCFFAIWPPVEVREYLTNLSQGFGAAAGRRQHPDDLHITLVFLGQINTEQMACVQAVGDGVRGEGFELSLDQMGVWPKSNTLWSGPSVTPASLAALVGTLQSGCQACGFPSEQRPYKPHVTLARKPLGKEGYAMDGAIAWPVSGFVLAASGGGRPGEPRYRILRRWTFAPVTQD